MKVIILDGTPDEIRQALPELGGVDVVISPSTVQLAKAQKTTADGTEESAAVSERVARKIISRRPLSPKMKEALKHIAAAGQKGILGTTLQQKLGLSRPQFTGLFGAFGNRIVNTPGHIERDWFFDQEWDAEESSFMYRLPETVRAALVAERLI